MKSRRTSKARQTELTFRTWGGAREGAGRKRSGPRERVSHLARPSVHGRHPLLVTMRVRRDVPNLRTQRAMAGVRRALGDAKRRSGLRVIHFSVQGNHLHLIVETADRRTLSRGMQGLAIRLARRINRAVARRGGFFDDRYHARELASPRQVRNALAYVLLNRQRHARQRVRFAGSNVDPCSSAVAFDGWRVGFAPVITGPPVSDLIVPAGSWLLTTGWRRHRPLDPAEIPGPFGSSS